MGADKSHRVETVVWARPLGGLALWALVVVFMFRYWEATRFVLLGLLAATALAAVLRPVAERLPGPRGLRAVMTLLLLIIVVSIPLGLLTWAMHGPVRDAIEKLPEIGSEANDALENISRRFSLQPPLTVSGLGRTAGRVLTGESATKLVSNVLEGLLATGVALLVIVIASMFILAHERGTLGDPAVKLLPPSSQDQTRKALTELEPELRWWFIGTLFSMAVIGVVSGLGYLAIGLSLALPLALFAGLAELVPMFGPMVTLMAALLVASTQGLGKVIGVVVIFLAVEAIESNFLTPMVMKRAVHIPPVVTIFTMVFWGNVFGVAGLILAVPINLVIWSLLKHHLIQPNELEKANCGG